MLSSQTKDTVTSVAVRRLQKELKGGLTIQSILDVPSEELNTIIGAVGFHNKKTIYLKQVAEICRVQYNGDIPDTAEALIALPGVGPKMVKKKKKVMFTGLVSRSGVAKCVYKICERKS